VRRQAQLQRQPSSEAVVTELVGGEFTPVRCHWQRPRQIIVTADEKRTAISDRNIRTCVCGAGLPRRTKYGFCLLIFQCAVRIVRADSCADSKLT
jgi:hypothetical protein